MCKVRGNAQGFLEEGRGGRHLNVEVLLSEYRQASFSPFALAVCFALSFRALN